MFGIGLWRLDFGGGGTLAPVEISDGGVGGGSKDWGPVEGEVDKEIRVGGGDQWFVGSKNSFNWSCILT